MASFVHTIDWKEEFDQFTPYLEGGGGVVRLQCRGDLCAHSAFLSTLKSKYEATDTHCSILIDSQVYSVRYLIGIRDEFVRKMGMELPDNEAITRPDLTVNVAKDLRAGRDIDVTIENLSVEQSFNGESRLDMAEARNVWIDQLCKLLAEFLKEKRIMVIINQGRAEDQDEFWRWLWQDKLERLTSSGLFLVHVVDISEDAQLHALAPNVPDKIITLPTNLTPSAQKHAVDDLANIIMSKVSGMTENDARNHAQALVATHDDDIPRLHRKYGALIMGLAREHG